MSHHCHADNCGKKIPPKLLFCLRHWGMLPKPFQNDIWRHYRPGQEVDKKPSREYMKAQTAARWVVAMLEKGFSLEQLRDGLEKLDMESYKEL